MHPNRLGSLFLIARENVLYQGICAKYGDIVNILMYPFFLAGCKKVVHAYTHTHSSTILALKSLHSTGMCL